MMKQKSIHAVRNTSHGTIYFFSFILLKHHIMEWTFSACFFPLFFLLECTLNSSGTRQQRTKYANTCIIHNAGTLNSTSHLEGIAFVSVFCMSSGLTVMLVVYYLFFSYYFSRSS